MSTSVECGWDGTVLHLGLPTVLQRQIANAFFGAADWEGETEVKLSQYVVQMLCIFTETVCKEKLMSVHVKHMPGRVVFINLYPKDVVAANEIHTVCSIQTWLKSTVPPLVCPQNVTTLPVTIQVRTALPLWFGSSSSVKFLCVPMLLLDLGIIKPCKSRDFNFFPCLLTLVSFLESDTIWG